MSAFTLSSFLILPACGEKATDSGGKGGDADTDTDTDTDTRTCTNVWYADGDSDGYGDDTSKVIDCVQPNGYVPVGGDCNDADPEVHDYTMQYTDADHADHDGYGDPSTGVLTCSPSGTQMDNGDDCDDTNASVSDEGLWYDDIDGDGQGNAVTATVGCEAGSGQVALGDDCNDLNANISPTQTEVCNLIDDDCDDTDAAINPSELEVCDDGIDQDCDGGAGACSISTDSVTAYDAKYKGASTSAYFGTTVGIGDLDGDGENDLAVGAYSPGAVYAFDTWTGTSVSATTAKKTFVPGTTSTYSAAGFGAALAIGDLNRDGLADILGGGNPYSSSKGLAALYTPAAAWSTTSYNTVTGGATSDYCGYALAVGDLTGDGNNDAVVACPGDSGGSLFVYQRTLSFGGYGDDDAATDAGAVWVFLGGGM